MISRRLELALERLQPSDWQRFERIASAFLASEFDDLRTVASPSGDEGRDAELFSPQAEPNVVIQYSVCTDWRAKINSTVRRLKETIPSTLVLLYLTNQSVGAEWDDLKKNIRTKHGITLDVRDRQWFVERVFVSNARQQAAEELAESIVDPYLSSAGVGPHVQAELSTPEIIAAVTYLGLQWQDDSRDKGLTRIVFEAIIRAVLVGTDGQNRLSRKEVHAKVHQILPDHSISRISILADSALKRLAKHKIKHWQREDEFCLAHEEVQRLGNYRVEAVLAESALTQALHKIVVTHTSVLNLEDNITTEFARTVRLALDAILFERSQAFAMAVQSGTLAELADTDFKSTLVNILSKSSLPRIPNVDWHALLHRSVRSALISDEAAIHIYLRSLSDAYTLLAFLKQTPDVQDAVEKMFSYGMLWLDATVVLPLLADTLAESDEERGRFSRMIEAAQEAGLKLFVTPGVIEEVERHMNKALTCAHMTYSQWEGSIPYLLERYISSGRSIASFPLWLENFRGESRPLQDISEYLEDQFTIKEQSLEDESKASSQELRYALRFMSIEMSLFLEKTIHFSSGFSTTSRLMLHSLAGLDP
ncbi:MAG: hypothetical protein HGB35_06980, partial [Geobacteraceae bacterium]|nr:hypothetical protein [Geobacteraceae bacterium]